MANNNSAIELQARSPGGETKETAGDGAVSVDVEKKGAVDRTTLEADGNCFTRNLKAGLEIIEDAFAAYGRFTTKRPILIIALSALLCILCALGFLNFTTESRPEELWVLEGTEALRDRDYVIDTWGNEPRYNVYYATASAGTSLLTRAAFQKLYELHERVLAINVTAESDASRFPGLWDYNRACFRFGGPGGDCATVTPLDLFDYNITLINSLSDAEIAARTADERFYRTSTGRNITQNDIFGLDGAGNIVAFRGLYTLDQHVVEEDGDRVDVVGEPWEEQGIDIFNGNNYPLDTVPMFASSWVSEFERGLEQDSTALTLAFIIIIVYLVLTLGRRDPVDCMVGLSCCAVISIGMALAASWGLSSAFGEVFSPLHAMIPFLLIGLGVDDAFILVTGYQRALAAGNTWEKSVELAMRTGGMSILITSLTDFLAFLIGSATNIPALSSFCVFAGIGVLFDFLFQITFFMACMVLNARRAEARRKDVLVCLKDQDDGFESYRTPARGFGCLKCGWFTMDLGEPIFLKFSQLLMTWPASVVTIISFLALIGLSSYGINQIETNFRADWFLPPDSYLLDAIDVGNDYFTMTTLFNVYIRDIDYFSRQGELNSIGSFLTSSREVLEGSSDYWFTAYLAWAALNSPYSGVYSSVTNTITDETLFYEGLSTFVNTNGTRYQQNIQFRNASNPAQGINAARSSAQIGATEFSGTGQDRFDAMQNLRDDLAAAMTYDDARAWTQSFIFWERFGFIREELVKNIGIALAVMTSIVFFLIVTLPIVSCVIVAIGATVLDVFGMAFYWGVQINFVVAIFLLIAVGLSVDYSAHIGHAFKEARGTAKERVVEALRSNGPPVFNAIFSTFLSILILANSQTYIFEIFFQMFTLTTLIGGFHGIVVLPVLLSFVGGENHLPLTHSARTLRLEKTKSGEAGILKQGSKKEAA